VGTAYKNAVLVLKFPDDLDIQPTFGKLYKDPNVLDQELGIGIDIVQPAENVTEADLQIVDQENRTVGDVRTAVQEIQEIFSDQLEVHDSDDSGVEAIIDNFDEIEPEILEEVLGAPMIQSVVKLKSVSREYYPRSLRKLKKRLLEK